MIEDFVNECNICIDKINFLKSMTVCVILGNKEQEQINWTLQESLTNLPVSPKSP